VADSHGGRSGLKVINYLARVDIERDVQRLYQIFPRPVADKIQRKGWEVVFNYT
jgi:hypothetical protein